MLAMDKEHTPTMAIQVHAFTGLETLFVFCVWDNLFKRINFIVKNIVCYYVLYKRNKISFNNLHLPICA